MLRVQTVIVFRNRPFQSFRDGAGAVLDLLLGLQATDALSGGWQVGDGPDVRVLTAQTRDEVATFLHDQEQADPIGRETLEAGVYGLTAESARMVGGRAVPMEQYVASVSFGGPDAPQLSAKIDLLPSLASLDLVRDIIARAAAWTPLQHVSVTEAFYPPEDSPIDPTRRRGLGWAGWVPFDLMDDEVTEAAVIEPLADGTFVATQAAYWEVTDREAVKRAQALELKLNALGALPTHRALASGTWGQAG